MATVEFATDLVYLGLGLIVLSCVALVRVYNLRREQPEKHADGPAWRDIRVNGAWSSLGVGIFLLMLGLIITLPVWVSQR